MREVQNQPYIQDFIRTYEKSVSSWGVKTISNRAKDIALESYRKVWKI